MAESTDLRPHRLRPLQPPPRIQTQPSLRLSPLPGLLRPRPREIPRIITKTRRRARPRPHRVRPVGGSRPRAERRRRLLGTRAADEVRVAPCPPGRGVQTRSVVMGILGAYEAVGREVLCCQAALLVQVDFVLGCGGDLDDALCGCCRYYCGRHGDY